MKRLFLIALPEASQGVALEPSRLPEGAVRLRQSASPRQVAFGYAVTVFVFSLEGRERRPEAAARLSSVVADASTYFARPR
ncbi:MAG: hypothetical protein K8R59_18595 [Thermoanaerobaculales bacterium]|nr:hypothetical protein [Thermoanaerobaculales bacterium]